jgi:hypothetical protein
MGGDSVVWNIATSSFIQSAKACGDIILQHESYLNLWDVLGEHFNQVICLTLYTALFTSNPLTRFARFVEQTAMIQRGGGVPMSMGLERDHVKSLLVCC